MKSIKLEQSKETVYLKGPHGAQHVEVEFDDKALLSEVINISSDGISISEMRERIKLLDKVDNATDTLKLEDAEFEKVKSLLENFKFGVVSKHVLKLCEKFTEGK